MMRNVLKLVKNQFFDLYFSSYRENLSKIGVILVQKLPKKDHDSKNNIGNLIFLSIQQIPHLSCEFEPFWKKEISHKMLSSWLIFFMMGGFAPHNPNRGCALGLRMI